MCDISCSKIIITYSCSLAPHLFTLAQYLFICQQYKISFDLSYFFSVTTLLLLNYFIYHYCLMFIFDYSLFIVFTVTII